MDNNKKSGVYQIVNKADGNKYIGSTVDIDRRLYRHLHNLKKGRHENKKLQSAWNEHGQNSFGFSVLEYCDVGLLVERERHYVDAMRPFYNISLVAGKWFGHKHTQETKAKLSAAHVGKKHTQATKEKLAAAAKGNKHGLGYKHTPEAKARMSLSRRGNKNALGNTSMLGRKLTQEHKDKMSAAQLARYAKAAQNDNKK